MNLLIMSKIHAISCMEPYCSNNSMFGNGVKSSNGTMVPRIGVTHEIQTLETIFTNFRLSEPIKTQILVLSKIGPLKRFRTQLQIFKYNTCVLFRRNIKKLGCPN